MEPISRRADVLAGFGFLLFPPSSCLPVLVLAHTYRHDFLGTSLELSGGLALFVAADIPLTSDDGRQGD